MNTPFEKKDFLVQELEKLGLIKGDRFLLDPADMTALLNGQRTDLITLQNLSLDGIRIAELSAKISVMTKADGNLDLMLHPVYNNGMDHPLLTIDEKSQLMQGEINNIRKVDNGANGAEVPVVIEYDRKTKEFITYNPRDVEAPYQVNQRVLSDMENEKFRHGEPLTFGDGSRLLYSASERSGVFSDYQALVLAYRREGELFYTVRKDLPPLPDSVQVIRADYGFGYAEAYNEMNLHMANKQTDRYLTPEQQPRAIEHLERKPRIGR